MKTLLLISIAAVAASVLFADDKIVRDANGKVTAIITKTTTGTIMRDPAGKIVENRQRSGSLLIVRDYSGNVIRKEEKARK